MQRQVAMMVAAALAAAQALAQSGGLSGVTMRVLDDIRGIDAVVLELDASRGAGDERAPTEEPAEVDRPSAGASSEDERRVPPREREAPDRGVEQPASPAVP